METTTADKHQRLPDLMEGTIIDGTFEILRKLGAGGMGGVYLVRDNTLGRTFALKTIAGVPRGVEMEVAYERFAREAKLAARLRHPAIVPVYHYGTDAANGITYYTMEDYLLTSGEVEHVCRDLLESSPPADRRHGDEPNPLTLADVLAGDRALGERAAVRIALDILPALETAHDFDPPIVHRDLKPSNLIFDKDGMLRLSDFGIARPLPEEPDNAADDDIHDSTFAALTLPDGPVPGTPSYAAPELAAGATPTPAADYFSFGLLLYRILTGGLPPRGRTMLPVETLQSVSPLWQPLLDRLLDENPDTRLADPAQAREAVEAIREAVAPRPRAPRRWLVAAIAASATAALVGGLALLARIAHAPQPAGPSDTADTAESSAVSWHVDAANGSDSASGLAWETAKRSIQAAIDAASPGDCIIVTNGVYDAIATDNKEVTIKSVNGARDTVIDGGGVRGCALLCHSDTGLSDYDHGTVLIGFTLRNGSTEGFGGIYGGVARNCIIEKCKRLDDGGSGGLLGSGARGARLYNCLVRDNAFCGVAHSSVYNCTIVDNGMYGCWDCHAYNSIVTGHATAFPYMSEQDHPNCVERDPLFVDPANGDYRLSDDSPCIDSGDNSHVDGDTDLDGNPRIVNGLADIGAYESQSPSPAIRQAIRQEEADNTEEQDEGATLAMIPEASDDGDAGDPDGLASLALAQMKIGITHYMRGQHYEAADYYGRAFHSFEEFRKLAGNSQIRNQVATGYQYAVESWRAGHHDKAISILDDLADILRDMMGSSDDPYFKDNLKFVRGSQTQWCMYLDRHEEAQKFYREFEALGDRWGQTPLTARLD